MEKDSYLKSVEARCDGVQEKFRSIYKELYHGKLHVNGNTGIKLSKQQFQCVRIWEHYRAIWFKLIFPQGMPKLEEHVNIYK